MLLRRTPRGFFTKKENRRGRGDRQAENMSQEVFYNSKRGGGIVGGKRNVYFGGGITEGCFFRRGNPFLKGGWDGGDPTLSKEKKFPELGAFEKKKSSWGGRIRGT